MKKATTSTPAPIKLLPMEEKGISGYLEDILAQTPEQFDANERTRLVEFAQVAAWCDVTEATANSGLTKATASVERERLASLLADSRAQRSLTKILSEIFPLIAKRNDKSAQLHAAKNRLAAEVADSETVLAKIADLEIRDMRIPPFGELPNQDAIEDEIGRIQWVIDSIISVSVDFREARFVQELENLAAQGKYHGDLTMEAAKERIEKLKGDLTDLEDRLANHLKNEEVALLDQIKPKGEAARVRIRVAENEVATIEEEYDTAQASLAAVIEAARIRAIGIIEARRIEAGMNSTPNAA